MRHPLLFLAAGMLLVGCSFSHVVRVENVSDAPVTLAYKIRPAPWQHGLFTTRPVALRRNGRETVADTTLHMDPADSVVTITLGPGEEAVLGHCMNCTLEVLTTHGGTDPWADADGNSRMNLYWMRIEQGGEVRTYTPKELVEGVAKNKLQRTLIRLKG